jgi:hypothetical protein
MNFTADSLTLFLGTATLLLLSLYTIVACRSQLSNEPETFSHFLFEAKTKRYSLAGAIGSVFSVTYYGATTIYGHLYRGWFIIFLVVSCLCAIGLARKIIDESASASGVHAPDEKGNALLDLLSRRLPEPGFRKLLALYALIYFFLLAEELAVSRLVLSSIFPGHPVVTATLLATVCLVILAYLKRGGFKAVLIADFEQLKLLFPFMVSLGLLIYRRPPSPLPAAELFNPRASSSVLALPLAVVMLVAWTAGSLDFYSRLNFRLENGQPRGTQQKTFATLALTLVFAALIAGSLFGAWMPQTFSRAQTPAAFTKAGVDYIVAGGSRATSVIFFASLFCMIFTTINNLLITLMQVRFYLGRSTSRNDDFSRLLLFATLASSVFWANCVSAVGLFVGAQLIVPTTIVACSLSDRLTRLLPKRFMFLLWSTLLSIVLFVFFYPSLETFYSRHYLVSAIVIVPFTFCALTAKLAEGLKS